MPDGFPGASYQSEIDQILGEYPRLELRYVAEIRHLYANFRVSRVVHDRFQVVENAISQLNQALTPYAEMATKLKDYDERVQSYVRTLQANCKALHTQLEDERRENLLLKEERERDVLRRIVC